MFDAIGHTYRRRILVALEAHNPQHDDDLTSDTVTGGEEDLELFEREVYHTHLPKLDEAGFIDWDRESGTITRGPRFDEVQPLIALMNAHRDELPADWP